MMIYVAAGLVVAALVTMASGRGDPLLALLVVLISPRSAGSHRWISSPLVSAMRA